jgi:hypothetical protein
MSSNPLHLLKQSTSHHRPFISTKSNPTQVLGIKYVDALARKSITTYYSDVANTSIKIVDPEGNPFYNIYWLAKEYEKHPFIRNHQNTAQSPTSRLWYLSNYHDALQAHMHPLHKLENANTVANYHEYYQTLIKNSNPNGAASNAYLKASYVPVRT